MQKSIFNLIFAGLIFTLISCSAWAHTRSSSCPEIPGYYSIEIKLALDSVYFEYTIQPGRKYEEEPKIVFKNRERFIWFLLRDLYDEPGEKNDVLFFIHGMWGSRNGILASTVNDLHNAYINQDQSPVARIVALKWPGNDFHYKDNKTLGLELSKKLAGELANLIRTIQIANSFSQKTDCRMHLLCHSLGNFLFANAASKLDPSQLQFPLFDEIIMAAPDLDLDVVEPGASLSIINHLATRIHLYFNRKDLTLKFSKDLNDKQRLGLVGIPEEYHPPTNFHQIDVTAINDDKTLTARINRHHYYRLSPIVAADILSVLKGEKSEKIELREAGTRAREYLLHNNVAMN